MTWFCSQGFRRRRIKCETLDKPLVSSQFPSCFMYLTVFFCFIKYSFSFCRPHLLIPETFGFLFLYWFFQGHTCFHFQLGPSKLTVAEVTVLVDLHGCCHAVLFYSPCMSFTEVFMSIQSSMLDNTRIILNTFYSHSGVFTKRSYCFKFSICFSRALVLLDSLNTISPFWTVLQLLSVFIFLFFFFVIF